MGQAFEVCGKKAATGNQITTRGRAKYLGGVGVKTTGISRRQFKPNLRTVRVTTPAGTRTTVRVCAQCIRNGAVTKTVRRAPFKLPAPAADKAAEAKVHAAAPAAAATASSTQAGPPAGAKVRKRKRNKE
jgi:large subunit ribosomal protein L28